MGTNIKLKGKMIEKLFKFPEAVTSINNKMMKKLKAGSTLNDNTSKILIIQHN